MADMNKLLGQLLGGGAASGFAGGLAGGLASSLLSGKKGRKMGFKALKLGGVAAVGAMAYTAYQRYSEKSGGAPTQAAPTEFTPAPPGSAFMPRENDHAANEALGLILVRAMIAVARADGRLDAEESQAIFQKIQSLGLDSESQALLVEEMGHPVDMDAIVNSATTPEIAAEIYTASLLAVEVDSAAEKAYLAMLAARLRLPPELVAEIEQQVTSQKELAQENSE
ncbi:tellurite resistance TerB family protein [Desulfopila inferna]|uniref:tellurite resistance TerB family protein n=1 Tax=Desulfopila inferna TaxID=468528 RepID=UPI0019646864|nr:tellurite resistance TerB family protein [Desulfopila inferna]MBM9603629.1 tellurite resistance TerB family protein [Desulfopila inferna]